MAKYYNPFQQAELRIPLSYREEVTRYTQTRSEAGEKADPQASPFDRYIDLWMLAVCIGAQEGRVTTLSREDSHRFEYGARLQGDVRRIELLELIAIAHSGDPFIINDPRQVIEIANGFAATGLPLVMEMIKDGHGKPLTNVTDRLRERLVDA